MMYRIAMALLLIPLGVCAGICDDISSQLQQQSLDKALPYYETCALSDNKDSAHMILARAYVKGEKNIPVNRQRALLFYHLAADNGNAQAQTELAELLLKLDETPEGRQEVQSYLRKIQSALKNQPSGEFKGQLLHPYTLLLLAAEKSDQKWYYPSEVLTDPKAAKALKAYKIDENKKRQALQDASVWKQQKMMQAARQVLSADEYKIFAETILPPKGKPDVFKKSQAINNLKTKVKAYREN